MLYIEYEEYLIGCNDPTKIFFSNAKETKFDTESNQTGEIPQNPA